MRPNQPKTELVALPTVDARVFSGTGNSLLAARWFAGHGGDVRMLDVPGASELRENSLLLLACPAHGFTAPVEILRFVKTLPPGAGRPAAVLVTRAGVPLGRWLPPGLAGTAPFLLALWLWWRGYAVRGALAVNMPSNWQTLHTGLAAPSVERIAKASRAEVERFAQRLRGGGRQWLTLNLLYELVFGLLLAPISLAYVLAGGRMLGQLYFATSTCTSCGQCGLACPVDAIAMQGAPARPSWSLSCTSCMRCMAYCPKRAIEGNWAWAVGSTALSLAPLAVAWRFLNAWQLAVFAVLLTALSVPAMPPLTRVLLRLARRPAVEKVLLALTPTRHWRRYRAPGARLRDLAPRMRKGSLLLTFLLASRALAAEPTPFAYHGAPLAAPSAPVTIQAETAVGTRDLRLLGGRGVEQALRVLTPLGPHWQAQVWGGAALGTDLSSLRGHAYGAGAAWQALREGEHGIQLQVAAGISRDYAGAVAPRLTLAASKRAGPWQVAAAGLAELPLGATTRRDAADVVLSVGVARRITPQLTVGLEAAGQDVEGLWDRAEAEGGARLVAGPLAAVQLGRLQLRGHAGAVWTAAPTGAQSEPGLLAKLTLVWGLGEPPATATGL